MVLRIPLVGRVDWAEVGPEAIESVVVIMVGISEIQIAIITEMETFVKFLLKLFKGKMGG